jgi:hypothetical protein
MFSFEGEGFSFSLDINKLQFLTEKKYYNKKFCCIFFLQLLVVKNHDPDWIRIQIHISAFWSPILYCIVLYTFWLSVKSCLILKWYET